MVYLNPHIEDINIGKALQEVSPQRREQAMRYLFEQDRKLSLAAYLLLCQGLREEYGIAEPPVFTFGPAGKPFLRDYPHIHFNLSHCPAAALCAIDSAPVGCDIENVQPVLDEAVCRQVCSREELTEIRNAPHPALAFTRLWTQKEAFLKYTGEGLRGHLGELLLSPEAKAVDFQTVVAADNSYVYTVCRATQTRRYR